MLYQTDVYLSLTFASFVLSDCAIKDLSGHPYKLSLLSVSCCAYSNTLAKGKMSY